MIDASAGFPEVSIVIPVLNKLEFTRQCLDRIWRHTGDRIPYEIIIVDNGSTDGTSAWFAAASTWPAPVRYHRNERNLGFAKANNIGARLARGRDLLFLNNDTLVRPGWLSEMLRIRRSDSKVGIVGIKQLFPYTNIVYHTGVVFAPGGIPQHLYPHLDGSLPHVNQEREYQAVTGACLLIDRALFEDCGGFDEAYLNGYEDTDLCMAVRQRGRKIVCCTSAYIYHYGQISEGRTADDDQNAALFARKWGGRIRVDQDEILARDRIELGPPLPTLSKHAAINHFADDCIYLADDLGHGSAQTWVNAELALALSELGTPVFVNAEQLSPTLAEPARTKLKRLVFQGRPFGGVQIKWSHYRAQHLDLELAGRTNLEFFVINYIFGNPGALPWDYWLQCLKQNGYGKLPVSGFCKSVLTQVGLPEAGCQVLPHGYSAEVRDVEPPQRRDSLFRFLTVTNSHDLGRYNTEAVLDAYEAEFESGDEVALVIKDYGATSGDTSLHDRLARRRGGARIEYITRFTDKRELIRLYKSCDVLVSAHRGEGFGMKILDAMACGLPVITPLFGGPTEYCTAENCRPVAFSLVPMSDCLDSRALRINNGPLWAEIDLASLRQNMRSAFAHRPESAAIGARARNDVIGRFTWEAAARKLVAIGAKVRIARPATRPTETTSPPPKAEHSPYWLGLRVSVVVPTHNRKERLANCLDALARQSILPQELEVIVVDDGSMDGTREWLEGREFPFRMRYVRQERRGPGAARNLGIEHAAGELVLFVGDDIYADEHLLEEHLLAHATSPAPGVAILGHIEWPRTMKPNAVMDYVCGDAMLQFAYSYIPTAPMLDHRFFYTSNISLKRQFLVDAAADGVRFDPSFFNAAFEDSEFALRLIPRGLQIRYAAAARAVHDHWMDLTSFAEREFRAGEMAVVFYRKHPAEDARLQVQWIADLVQPALALVAQPEFLRHLEAFDSETGTLLSALAAALEQLIAIDRRPGSPESIPLDRSRAALHNVLRVVFDLQRTRGKLQEWFSSVDDPAELRAAQTLASVMRKIEFLNVNGAQLGALGEKIAPVDAHAVAELHGRLAQIPGMPSVLDLRPGGHPSRGLRRLVANPAIVSRLIRADRFVEARLQSALGPAWLAGYRRVRRRLRSMVFAQFP